MIKSSKPITHTLGPLALACFLLSACGGGDGGSDETINHAPLAQAKYVQSAPDGSIVTLDGSASSDADGDALTYAWELISIPNGSKAYLLAPTSVKPTFTADVAGTYEATLVVSDGRLKSAAKIVSVSIQKGNVAPIAEAGNGQNVLTNAVVTLNGNASSDTDGDNLVYTWSLTTRPVGSAATLSDVNSTGPSFTADVAGVYEASLIVNDGKVNSTPDTVKITAKAQPVGGLSDEFSGTALDNSWSILNGDNFSYEVSGNALHITPKADTLWWKATGTGAMIYKTVTGNFKLTTAVRARSATNPSLAVGPVDYQFGGIMARDPSASTNNYVFGVVGDRGATPLEIETKSTANNVSSVQGAAWPSGDAELRICRLGATFHIYVRSTGSNAWAVATPWGPPYDRPDMPATLQVGPIAYAWTTSPDLRASFEYVHIETTNVTKDVDCVSD